MSTIDNNTYEQVITANTDQHQHNTQLTARLYLIACEGLSSANKGNPFWTKSQAMSSINKARILIL